MKKVKNLENDKSALKCAHFSSKIKCVLHVRNNYGTWEITPPSPATDACCSLHESIMTTSVMKQISAVFVRQRWQSTAQQWVEFDVNYRQQHCATQRFLVLASLRVWNSTAAICQTCWSLDTLIFLVAFCRCNRPHLTSTTRHETVT